MADSEDLKLLASGELDLSRCDFREANLGGMDLRGRNFTHCLFGKAECEGTKFDGSDFRNATLSFIRARSASFDGCLLEGRSFGYADLSGASLKDVKARGARFQKTKLSGANLEGANLTGGSIDADTVLDGVISDERTNFEGLKVLRPTSRHPLFTEYRFENGTLRKQSSVDASVPEVSTTTEQSVEVQEAIARQPVKIAKLQLQNLVKHAVLTRVTAQQFAGQIEEILRDVPAAHDNKLVEPLQTMLEVAEVLRNLAPASEALDASLDRDALEERIAELEALVDRLTLELSDETNARKAAEELAASDGFRANFLKSAGKAAGYASVSAVASIVAVGVPTVAVHFLGVEHPVVTAFFNVLGRLPK